MPWGFEGWRALKHQGVQCLVSDDWYCFLKGKSTGLGRERGRYIAMNHFILFSLINRPKFGYWAEREKDMQEHWMIEKGNRKRNKTPFCPEDVFHEADLTIWQNHSCKRMYFFLSTPCFRLQWVNEQVSPCLFPFSSASTKDTLKSLYHWHKNV